MKTSALAPALFRLHFDVRSDDMGVRIDHGHIKNLPQPNGRRTRDSDDSFLMLCGYVRYHDAYIERVKARSLSVEEFATPCLYAGIDERATTDLELAICCALYDKYQLHDEDDMAEGDLFVYDVPAEFDGGRYYFIAVGVHVVIPRLMNPVKLRQLLGERHLPTSCFSDSASAAA